MVVDHSILIDLDIDHISANMHEVVNLADDLSDIEQNISYILLELMKCIDTKGEGNHNIEENTMTMLCQTCALPQMGNSKEKP